ncbi:phage/plasmid replication protein [uncultured Porticoccus sp.]|uniref:phage/plasmid replication domain-containing protein n=1 Tax=uncultured Porticoccus sp. TaxID=1256050 RepID=UPI0030D972B4
MTWFIDKLNVHQDHQRPLPLVGEQMVIRVELSTGEPISESPNFKLVEGSHSTKLTVRCDGSRVKITGNASRFHRIDNLFGLETIDDCIKVYNQVLASVDLPPFTKCTQVKYRQGEEGGKVQLVTDGALIDHIDWTRNHSVPPGTEDAFLRGISSQSLGRGKTANLHVNGKTVDWYQNSKWLYKKLYNKAFELSAHRAKNLKNASKEDAIYYNQLIEFCQELGLIREEHSFKQPWLERHNLRLYGRLNEADFLPHLTDIENIFKRLDDMTHTRYEMISEQLLIRNIVNSTQSANSTQAVAFKWLHGQPIARNSQYYIHRSRLLQIGIDISIPYDVTRVPPTVRSTQVIEVKSVKPPSWYRMPIPITRPQLHLVA